MEHFELEKGITVGEGDDAINHTECVIDAATCGDLVDAAKAATSVELAPTGRYNKGLPTFEPMAVVNPYLMEIELLYRQVKRIGDLDGPLNQAYWRLLSEDDINLIRQHAEQLRDAPLASQEVVLGGREDDRDTDGQKND